MHLKEDRTGQQAWSSANFCFLILESILFFSPFPFLNSPVLELKNAQNSSTRLALPSCSLLRVCGTQCPLQPFSTAHLLAVHCNAPAKSEKMCKDQRKSLHWQRKDCAHQPLHQIWQLCRLTERRMPEQPHSPSQRADHSTSPEVLHTYRKQENILEVHHCCSPTTKLPLPLWNSEWKCN